MSYIAEIETRISGIPCIIGVKSFESQGGSYSYNAASDYDYYGYTEIDWEVLDRKGYKADWLARKMTSRDELMIENAIVKHFEEEQEYEF
jgi:NADH:ubiquinone oxidoreductase subunit D